MNRHAVILGLALAALATGCTLGSAAENTNSAEGEYRSWRSLAHDAYTCHLTGGAMSVTATVDRQVSERISDPSKKLLSQSVSFSAPLFSRMERELGHYGCARFGSTWDLSSRADVTDRELPALSFDVDEDTQWANCEYNAHQAARVTDEGGSISAEFTMTGPSGRSVSLSGSCTKSK